ncbi:lasso peptide biosynthesis B2 protein [Longimicrobium sp.]|jgi:hypothetical protein|uniref:lasso peptide biosynthesis B2 protein n=1 Tax=Longimicrobium sp. TaxID=2029185 RepID=UPI002ED91DB7
MRLADAALSGVWAGLRVPVWLRGRRWTELLREPPAAEPGARPPRGAVRAALVTVGVLARVPGLPWKRTCLYRSVAECLVLRRYGVPAVVRIGVKSEGSGQILAHAWVVPNPAAEPPAPDAMRAFSIKG